MLVESTGLIMCPSIPKQMAWQNDEMAFWRLSYSITSLMAIILHDWGQILQEYHYLIHGDICLIDRMHIPGIKG